MIPVFPQGVFLNVLPSLVHSESAQPQAVTVKMRQLGRSTRAIETHIGRIGVWYPTRSLATTQLALLYEPRHPYGPSGGEFAQVAGRALTPDHQRIWVEMMSEYLRAGRLEARAGSVPAAQLARCLGCELRRDGHVPAKVDARVRRLVHDLTRAQFRGSLRVLQRGAGMREFTLENTLQLVDSPTWRPGPDGFGHLYFGVPAGLAEMIHDVNELTFLNAPTWDAIRAEDELAALIWVMWESERIPPDGMTYPVFSGAAGGILDEAKRPGLAELFHLGYSERRETVRRLRKAIDCAVECDSRYAGTTIERHPREAGMWNTRVMRTAYVAGVSDQRVSRRILGAWQSVYSGQRPSAKQRDIIREMVERRGEDWIADALTVHAHTVDPFAEVLALDARMSKQRTREIRADEREAEANKEREMQMAVVNSKVLQLTAAREHLLSAAIASVEESSPSGATTVASDVVADADIAAVPDSVEKLETPNNGNGFFASRVGDLLRAGGILSAFGSRESDGRDDGVATVEVVGRLSPTVADLNQ